MPKHISDYEHKTHDLFRSYLDIEALWSPSAQMIANIFNAFPSRSFKPEQIKMIARATDGASDLWNPQHTLTSLVKAKILRSRVKDGVRRYEVNY